MRPPIAAVLLLLAFAAQASAFTNKCLDALNSTRWEDATASFIETNTNCFTNATGLTACEGKQSTLASKCADVGGEMCPIDVEDDYGNFYLHTAFCYPGDCSQKERKEIDVALAAAIEAEFNALVTIKERCELNTKAIGDECSASVNGQDYWNGLGAFISANAACFNSVRPNTNKTCEDGVDAWKKTCKGIDGGGKSCAITVKGKDVDFTVHSTLCYPKKCDKDGNAAIDNYVAKVVQDNFHVDTDIAHKCPLSGGAIAGIVIGALVGSGVLVVAVAIGVVYLRRRRKQILEERGVAAPAAGGKNYGTLPG